MQVEQKLEAAAENIAAERQKMASDVAQRMDDALRTTTEEVTAPLEADRVRSREAVAALRQLLVATQTVPTACQQQ